MRAHPGLPPTEHTATKEFLNFFDSEFPPLNEKVRRDEIGGLDLIVERLETYKRAIDHPQLYDMYGVRPPRGFILSGPSGCGKTYIAKYLAEELGSRFVDIPLSKYESKWVGEAEKGLVNYINMCRTYYGITQQPTLLFFDEAEEAFKSRELQGWHGPRVNVLLREMDGLSGDNTGLYFGAATNYLGKVDSALMRPGRLDHHIEIPAYDIEGLSDVFRAIMTRLNRRAKHFSPFFLTDKELATLGYRAFEMKFTPAHINNLFSRATDRKIKMLCERTPDQIVNKAECLVTGDDLIYEMDNYGVVKIVHRRVGFSI